MSITVEGAAQIRARFELVASDQTKRRVLVRIANKVVSNSKKRIQTQSDLNASPWAPRKSGKRKKMLSKLGPLIKVTAVNANEANIGFYSSVAGKIAAKQQFGATEEVTAEQVKNRPGATQPSNPATTRQAAALLNAGFKIRLPKGKRKTPTKKWITEHMTAGQAGVVLRALQGEIKAHWRIVLPPRSFLGVTDTELPELNEIAINEMQSAIGL